MIHLPRPKNALRKKWSGILLAAGIFLLWGLFFLANNRAIPEVSLLATPTIKEWQSRYDKIRTFVIETEQTRIPPRIPGHIETALRVEERVSFPEDGWLIGFEPEFLGAPSLVLHHSNLVDLSSPSPFCSGDFPNIFFATGRELTSGVFPVGYGYPIARGATILHSVMYHNPTGEKYGGARVRLKVFYIPKGAEELHPLEPLPLDVKGPCEVGELFHLPPGNFFKAMPKPYELSQRGRIIIAGGHLHDFATYLILKKNGRSILTFTPIKNSIGEIVTVPVFYPKALWLDRGDQLMLETSYYNPSADREVHGVGQALIFISSK